VAQPEFFGLVEVDLDLGATGVGPDGRDGLKFKISGHQVPRFEFLQPGHDHDYHSRPQCAPFVHTAQENFGVVDFDLSLFALNVQFAALFAQPIGESPE
jgi:hypothetical protein